MVVARAISFDNYEYFEKPAWASPSPLHPYRWPISSCIGGHNKACLTGSQVQSPAPDGNKAIIGAGEEV